MLRFNRYIVECKYKQEKDIKAGEWVLIDTQWNVNLLCLCCCAADVLVLIDTQWNVNTDDSSSSGSSGSFNRYIVECKFKLEASICICHNVLIDTQWNVNQSLFVHLLHLLFVLIDTQWNVNIGLSLMAITMGIVLIDTQWNINFSDNELKIYTHELISFDCKKSIKSLCQVFGQLSSCRG